jgi:hypothetical protein
MGIQVRTSAPVATDAPATDTAVLPIHEVLSMAQASDSVRTRNLGEKIAALLADLAERVNGEAAEAKARAEAERIRSELAAKEARLAQELAHVRQSLRRSSARPGSTESTPTDMDPKVVRAWAAENGMECNAKGRVPQRVVDAWREATGSEVAQ